MPDFSKGSFFAGYRIEGVAGRGGMGVVYRATQLALERQVALKLIAPELIGDVSFHDFRARFKSESRTAAAIDHQNVIPIYEADEAEGQLFISMRYVEGTDLRTLVAREGRLMPERAVGIVEQIAWALDAAHRRGLLHRDVKPANVLVVTEGRDHAYLTDFGLAKHAASVGAITGTGQFVGTLDYAAPEQIEGKPLDAGADVYALGGVLFHALAGRVPYPKEGEAAKVYAHLAAPPPALRSVVPDAPTSLQDVIETAMAKDPGERYPSAGALAKAARDALEAPARVTDAGSTSPKVVAAAPAAGSTPAAGTTVRAERKAMSTALGPTRAARLWTRRWLQWLRDHRAIWAGVLAVSAGALLFALLEPGSGKGRCGTATELRVLTSADKEEAIRDAADDHMAKTKDGDGCRTVSVGVTAATTSRPAINALRDDWDEWDSTALGQVGPQPDVWLPESSVDARQVRRTRGEGGARLSVGDKGSIGSTRLVLASIDHGGPKSVRSGQLGRLRGLRTVRTNPDASTAGLLATQALYAAAPDTEAARRAVEREVVIVGDDPRALLCQVRLTPRRLRQQSAFLVPENVLADFNNAQPLGGSCAGPSPRLRREEKLQGVMLNPGRPTVFDNPCLLLSAREPADEEGARKHELERRQAATGFCEYLQGEDGQSRLRGHGFADPSPGAPAGIRPSELLAQAARARPPAHVLLAIDVSSSMKEPLPPTGTKRRLDAAREAAHGALEQIDDRDTLGLWTFAVRSRRAVPRQLEPLEAATPGHRDQIDEDLKGIRPAGGTPLYDTIEQGVAALRRGGKGDAIDALVVLTDGQNNYRSGLTLEQLARHLDAADDSERTPVRLFVTAALGGKCAELFRLTPAFRGGCFQAASPGAIRDTFRAIFASFGRVVAP